MALKFPIHIQGSRSGPDQERSPPGIGNGKRCLQTGRPFPSQDYPIPKFRITQFRPAEHRQRVVEAYNLKEAEEFGTRVQMTHGGWQTLKVEDVAVQET